MEILKIDVDGIKELQSSLEAVLSAESKKSLNREIGINVRERTADHIGRASVTRHKTADSLGAPHSGFLEFAPARGMLRGGSNYKGEDGSTPYTEVQEISTSGVTVAIGNTPGLTRALHSLTITPKKAKALTIPINAISYAKSVREVSREGWRIHREGKVLKGTKGHGKEPTTIPLFVLCSKSVIPQDRGLLPMESEISEWVLDSAEAFLEAKVDALG